jgi:hypothetical protein
MDDEVTVSFTADPIELYSDLCNAAARVLYNIPDDDPFFHTGTDARHIANNVLEVLTRRSEDGEHSAAPRSRDEVKDAQEEMFHRVWYHRKMMRDHEDAISSDPMREIEERYGKDTLVGLSDFQVGMLHGKLSALRWVMGSEWDFLDT